MNKKSLKEYRIWRAMKARCYAPSATKGNYKKFGITVCDRWKNSFDNFIADMGTIPDDSYSLERIDNYKGYSPENCKWIPRKDQPKNRTNLRIFTINGQSKCLKEWARLWGIKYTTLYAGIYRYGKPITAYIPVKEDNN